VRWPAGFRAYPAQTEVRVAPQGGRIAGSKIFRFLAVPDSAGNFTLPEMRYPYFDPATGRFEVARSTPQALAVAPGAEPRAARLLPALMPRRGELPADRLSRELSWEGWLAVLLLPPVVAGLARRRRRHAPASGAEQPGAHALTRLGRLEREFVAVLASHVSDPFARDGDGLAQALRAAGVDNAVADHVKRLRDRLRAARYGPRGLGDSAELSAEIEQVLRVLGADGPKGSRRPHAILASAIAGIVIVGAQHAAPLHSNATLMPAETPDQSPSAEALYEAGALRVAADSFSARAAREPRDPAHWFNLGATLYRAGADGKATAAWTVAARLAPRDASIRRARALLPPPDLMTEELLRVGWATPGEWIVVAAAAWVAFWFAVVVASRRRIVLAAFAAVTLTAITFGAIEQQRRDQPAAVVVAEAAPVRTAPYGGASAAATIQAGGALLVTGSYGPWREVRRNDGIHGWVLNTEIAAL
jgi:SH3 domain-containing protein